MVTIPELDIRINLFNVTHVDYPRTVESDQTPTPLRVHMSSGEFCEIPAGPHADAFVAFWDNVSETITLPEPEEHTGPSRPEERDFPLGSDPIDGPPDAPDPRPEDETANPSDTA